jgi:hypothetical protein
MISTDVASMMAMTRWNAPVPLSMRGRERRRAPATDVAAAYTLTTKAASSR